jgi:hypothetical protein
MKTMVNKTNMLLALALLTLGLNAQNTTLKKACIKIDKNDNGQVTKIDTCVTAATDAELHTKLKALGLDDLPGLPALPEIPETPSVPGIAPVPPVPPVPPIEGQELSVTKTIIIDDGNDDSRQKVKVVSNGDDDQVIVMDENGKITSCEAGRASANVVVKHLKNGERPDVETEKILKDNHIVMENGGEGKQVIIKNSKGKDGKDIKVYIFKNVEIQKLSETDKKQLPADASQQIEKAKPFNGLNVAPNPTDDACQLSYVSNSKEPLQIKVYDMNGKTVYTETDKNATEQVSKTLYLGALGAGTYFIHCGQGKQSEIRKILVQ